MLLRRSILLIGFFLYALPFFVFAQTPEERAALQAQLDQIERDIANNQGSLSELQKERTSLERDIAILDNKIKSAQLAIKKSDLTLNELRSNIVDKQQAILILDGRVDDAQESLAQMLRQTRLIDDISLPAVALGGSLTALFNEIDDFQAVQSALGVRFDEMMALRSDLETRKKDLEGKQEEAKKVRDVAVLAKRAVEIDEKEKQEILSTTKGQEKAYQTLIADKKKQAAAIRNALFGLRDSGAIPFGTAFDYAKEASVKTGVRPAIILAILTQETNLGQNVGSCSYTTAMHPTRDVPVFLELMAELGFDPEQQKVSCKPSYGWGGAMGPAQFIPSTWKLYKQRISAVTGTNPPNPWDGRTAVFSTALLMSDNGADQGTRTAERTAALKYFAGGNWNKKAYAFYGDDVMEIADRIQSQIDILQSE